MCTDDVEHVVQLEAMIAVDERVWHRVPGYDDDDSDSDAGDPVEEEFGRTAQERLEAIIKTLGNRYAEAPVIEFAAVPVHSKAPPTLKLRTPQPPNRLSISTPVPSFRIDRVHAPIVSKTFIGNGLCPTVGRDWLVQWSGPGMRDLAYQGLHEYQRVNHFPGSTELTRKDRLWAHFHEMKQAFGGDTFDFVPQSYVLPDQVEEFLDCYERTNHIWIVKPNASSQGKGIFLLRDLEDLPLTECNVVSRYVDNPLLIQGLKFDLRIYVLVTSYSPLRAYVYREGLVRFASSPYSTQEEHLRDAYRHLTNYSVNKSSKNFVENQELDSDNYGHKWSLSALNKHLRCVGINSKLMWARIMDLLVKTLLSVEPCIASKTQEVMGLSGNCFEVYGFDVLVDKNLKPWLLEVNLSPSMKADSPLDWKVKSSLLSDAFNLVGIRNPDRHAIAASRFRSRVLYPRRSFDTRPGSRSGSKSSVGAAPHGDRKERPVPLDRLREDQLRMLEASLGEVGRCRNFIRLHPTRNSIERYFPLIDHRGPRARDVADAFRVSQAAVSRLLSMVLFGPPPVLHGSTVARTRSIPAALSAPATEPEVVRPPAGEATADEDEPEGPEGSDVTPTDEQTGEVEVSCDAHQVMAALNLIQKLAVPSAYQLAAMEYLVRIRDACNMVRAQDPEQFARGAVSTRLSRFCERVEDAVGQRLPAHMASGQAGGADERSLPDRVAIVCCTHLESLSRELHTLEGLQASDWSMDLGSASLSGLLPPSLAQSAAGQQAVSTLAATSRADLECVLQDPGAPPGYKCFLEGFVEPPARSPKLPDHPLLKHTEVYERPVLGRLQHRRPPTAPKLEGGGSPQPLFASPVHGGTRTSVVSEPAQLPRQAFRSKSSPLLPRLPLELSTVAPRAAAIDAFRRVSGAVGGVVKPSRPANVLSVSNALLSKYPMPHRPHKFSAVDVTNMDIEL